MLDPLDVVCAECEVECRAPRAQPLRQRCRTFGCKNCDDPNNAEPEVVEVVEDEHEDSVHGAKMSKGLFAEFEKHAANVRAAHSIRREELAFLPSASVDDLLIDANASAAAKDIDDGLGVRLPDDEFQGDTNFRTLQALLARVDQRGFERCACATFRFHGKSEWRLQTHIGLQTPLFHPCAGRRTNSSFTKVS